ncbi:rho GTPase-activating protein 19-like isoform X2 [Aethina tumida]|uniref:rho GTPase-activating protein 19-like isoform X2 n=1 Tax=Aethina tumida TaxID=116153 RepID=UPI00096AF028|nr:rho GTPase-activating protein 19-like isoform X2 [Aethina tumida]
MSVQTLSDECLVEQFRRENTEQFLILARMHLSFLLDLNTDDDYPTDKNKQKKWPFSRSRKTKNLTEGPPLTQEGICQVYQLIEFIKKDENITVEGVFRRTGSLERQQELRNLLVQGVTIDLEGGQYTVHDCASVLKGFLSDLPEPLLTEAYFPACCQISELYGIVEQPTQEGKLLEALNLILLLLPVENQALLKDLLELLHLTASFEENNKMSPDNLGKMFTPHFLCPRKLTPSDLLTATQKYFGLISFMIKKSDELFKIPPKLKVDFQARYERKKLCADKALNESVTDTANTVFTFVDHERTAKENESNPTETALAQLYAHIQSLPESSKKRKLVSKFNKENGHGTPLQVIRSNMTKKSFGDSIKKHIFHKGLVKNAKKAGFTNLRSSSEEMLNSPQQTVLARARLFCGNCDSSTDLSNDEASAKKLKASTSTEKLLDVDDSPRSKSGPELSVSATACNNYLTSTPACVPLRACPDLIFTPEDQDRKSMSPITRSTQRMTRAMQVFKTITIYCLGVRGVVAIAKKETMMTPRSRKPVLLLSGTNINALPKIDKHECQMDQLSEERSYETQNEAPCKDTESTSPVSNALSATFKEYLSSRDILTSSPAADESFSSRTDDFNSTDFKSLNDSKLTDSLLFCLNGNEPDGDAETKDNYEEGEKELVLKPKQYDQNGKPIVFETSF